MERIVTKLLTTLTLSLLSTQLFAGGSISISKLPDAIVKCSGDKGEILFNVFKKEYRGEMLNIRDNNSGIVKLTEPLIINQVKAAGLIHEMNWDQTRFLLSLGLDPAKVVENIALFITKSPESNQIQVTNMQGGTLMTSYSSLLNISISPVAPFKVVAPKIQHMLHITLDQESEETYKIKLNKIQLGQQVCIREKEMLNPYFTPGSGGKPTFIGCVEYKDISEQRTVAVMKTELKIDRCELVK